MLTRNTVQVWCEFFKMGSVVQALELLKPTPTFWVQGTLKLTIPTKTQNRIFGKSLYCTSLLYIDLYSICVKVDNSGLLVFCLA